MCALFLIFGFVFYLVSFLFFVTASHPFSSVFTGTLFVGRVALKPTDMQLPPLSVGIRSMCHHAFNSVLKRSF